MRKLRGLRFVFDVSTSFNKQLNSYLNFPEGTPDEEEDEEEETLLVRVT